MDRLAQVVSAITVRIGLSAQRSPGPIPDEGMPKSILEYCAAVNAAHRRAGTPSASLAFRRSGPAAPLRKSGSDVGVGA